jgi:glutathione synthase/RimK-type ligase-like ATP-grasp enzyme
MLVTSNAIYIVKGGYDMSAQTKYFTNTDGLFKMRAAISYIDCSNVRFTVNFCFGSFLFSKKLENYGYCLINKPHLLVNDNCSQYIVQFIVVEIGYKILYVYVT